MQPFRDRLPEADGARTVLALAVVLGCSALFRVVDQVLLLRWPRLFVAATRLWWTGLTHSPYREGSFARKNAARKAKMSESELRYGETPIFVARLAMKRAGVTSSSKVLDLGAGRGRVLIATRTLGAEVIGVELLDEVRAPAAAVFDGLEGASLIAGDALTTPLDDDVTHVWATWTCLSEARRQKLAERLAAELPDGAIVLGVSLPAECPGLVPQWSATTWFTWGRDLLWASRVERPAREADPGEG
jgi:SAM-dependent methyltransferase